MAEGAWVPAFDSLWSSPKTKTLAKQLHVSRHAAGGLFLELMSWARDAIDSGDLGGVPTADLATAVGLPGRHGRRLLDALKTARFVSDDDRAHVLGWEDGPGKLVARRVEARERKRRQRGRGDGVTRDGSTEQPAAPHLSRGTRSPAERPVQQPVTRDREFGHADVTLQRRGEESRREPLPQNGHVTGTGTRLLTPDELRAEHEGQALEIVMGAEGLWRHALEAIRQNTTLTNFVTWFAGTRLERRGTTYCVIAPNEFARDWLTSKHTSLIKASIGVLIGDVSPDVRVCLEGDVLTTQDVTP